MKIIKKKEQHKWLKCSHCGSILEPSDDELDILFNRGNLDCPVCETKLHFCMLFNKPYIQYN